MFGMLQKRVFSLKRKGIIRSLGENCAFNLKEKSVALTHLNALSLRTPYYLWICFALSFVFLASCSTPPNLPSSLATPASQARIYQMHNRLTVQTKLGTVQIHALTDSILQVELTAQMRDVSQFPPIPHTLSVLEQEYSGAQVWQIQGTQAETAAMRIIVSPETLCLDVYDKLNASGERLTVLCPLRLQENWKGFTIDPSGATQVYGLGEQFGDAIQANGDWVGRNRTNGGDFGNALVSWQGGTVGNLQIPVAYFLKSNGLNWALFLDNAYKQSWNFSGGPWYAEMFGDDIRFYLLAGKDLPALRQNYLQLTGRPPVPPKKMFGMWLSEYGFDNWAELDAKVATLTAQGFPLDGAVLDLQWYGGVKADSDETNIGSFTWDERNFPDPVTEIQQYLQKGVGLMLIEQSYLGKQVPSADYWAKEGYLVRACADCSPLFLSQPIFWGHGYMLDWTNPAAALAWHNQKRQPLIDMGILGHWTDLGEPETYDPNAIYHGYSDTQLRQTQSDVHNLYNLYWSDGIARGYAENNNEQRLFILSRSGAAGSQRYGVALWSGDIASSFESLTVQQNVQMHLSMSGIDYFGSDVGGFWRQDIETNLPYEKVLKIEDELYTQWFANSAMFDVPLRPHTLNLCNCVETAPDRVGDIASNLANLRLRYALIPYLYSLAHRAWLYGEPLFPPLVYYYQTDPQVVGLAQDKMIGRDLLVGTAFQPGLETGPVYLPAGDWVDFYTNRWIESPGAYLENVSWRGENGNFRLPMFARAGAIIPMQAITPNTRDALGLQADGSVQNRLVVRVYPSQQASEFTLYEDDGQSIAYQMGEVQTTRISQLLDGNQIRIDLFAVMGTYPSAPAERSLQLQVILPADFSAASVTWNDTPLPETASDLPDLGWNSQLGVVTITIPSYSLASNQQFAIQLGKVSAPAR